MFNDNFGAQEREGDERAAAGAEERIEAPLIDLTSPREEEIDLTSPREEEEEDMLVSFTQ